MFEKYFTKKKLVCFDFDGLLVNTEPVHHKAYNLLFDSLRYPISLDFSSYCKLAHHPDRELFKNTVHKLHPNFPYKWIDIRKEKTNLYRKLLKETAISPMEGAEAILELLHKNGIKTCIVTNSDRCDVEEISLQLTFLNKIPLWITREDYNNPKPAPDGYLLALKHHNILKDEAIGLEDTRKGISALQRAGLDYLLVNKSCKEQQPNEFSSLSKLVL